MPTLLAYRQALSRALDDVEVHVVASSTPSTLGIASTINAYNTASVTRYNDRWVYVNSGPGAGQQRHVVVNSFAPLTGGMQVTQPWTILPTAGSGVEFTGLFPCSSGSFGADVDYRSIINRTLGQLLCEDRVTDPITTADTYPQPTRPWLNRPDRLIAALEPAAVAGRAAVDASWRGARVVPGPTPAIQLAPFLTATGVVIWRVWRPGSSLVNGAESTVGLVADTDTALPRVEDVVLVALVECYWTLATRNSGRPHGQWLQKVDQQRAWVTTQHAVRMQQGDRTLELVAAAQPQQQQQEAVA